jgi:RNA polymerase-binding transcription factor DksA
MEKRLADVAANLHCRVDDVEERLQTVLENNHAAGQEIKALQAQIAKAQVSDVDDQIRDLNGVKALVQKVKRGRYGCLEKTGRPDAG